MAFAAGQPLTANDLNMTPATNTDATSRTTTSAVYTTTLSPANICGVAFTGPPSGKVMIHWAAESSNSGVSGFCLTSPEVRTGTTVGSGTVVLAASDDNITRNDDATANVAHRVGASYLLTGLTSGTSYNVALNHRVSVGTGTYLRRSVIIVPQLA